MNAELYDQDLNYYAWLAGQVDFWETDQAKALGKMMIEKFNPSSVIDMGCSSGVYLVPFLEKGLEVHGVDGASGGEMGHWIPGNFEISDLRKPYIPAHRYDLCYCVETLEHIRPDFAEIVVESLTRCSDLLFISAARPGQGGEGHVNEQDKGYWTNLFGKFNYRIHHRNDEVMAVINSDPVYDRTHWLRWNGMLLEKL